MTHLSKQQKLEAYTYAMFECLLTPTNEVPLIGGALKTWLILSGLHPIVTLDKFPELKGDWAWSIRGIEKAIQLTEMLPD